MNNNMKNVYKVWYGKRVEEYLDLRGMTVENAEQITQMKVVINIRADETTAKGRKRRNEWIKDLLFLLPITKIRKLEIGGKLNQYTHCFFTILEKCRYLREFHLNTNRCSVCRDFIPKISKMKVVEIVLQTKLSAYILYNMGLIEEIGALSITTVMDRTEFLTLPKFLGSCVHLKILSLRASEIDVETMIEMVKGLPSLMKLNINGYRCDIGKVNRILDKRIKERMYWNPNNHIYYNKGDQGITRSMMEMWKISNGSFSLLSRELIYHLISYII